MLYRKTITLAVCLWLFSACPALTATAPTKIVVGYAAINGRVAPMWIASEQGFLAKYGLQAEQVYVRGAPLLVAGMASGDIQFTRSGGSATLAAVGAGHDFKIVATFSSRNTYDLIARPNIKRPEDLRGKKIALISIGATGWMGCNFGSSISVSINSAIKFTCRFSAIKRCRCKPSKPASPMPPRSMACTAKT